jgi:alkaline phosphatase D
MKPNFPYVPFEGGRIRGMDLLADYLWPTDSTNAAISSTPQPSNMEAGLTNYPGEVALSAPAEFMLFLGDSVYADVPYYFGDNLDAYRRLYRRIYQSPSFRRVYERLRGLKFLP